MTLAKGVRAVNQYDGYRLLELHMFTEKFEENFEGPQV
jgi:hypothetical protein